MSGFTLFDWMRDWLLYFHNKDNSYGSLIQRPFQIFSLSRYKNSQLNKL